MTNKTSKLAESSDLLKIFADKDETVLLALLSEYAGRWRHSNNQMWSIGAVFIPLSLSGIVLGLDDKYKTLGIALFSIVLIWIWYLTSAGLRSLIDSDWKVYAAVESALLKLNPPRLKRGVGEIVENDVKKSVSLRKVRLLIPIVITIAWIFTVILSFALP